MRKTLKSSMMSEVDWALGQRWGTAASAQAIWGSVTL